MTKRLFATLIPFALAVITPTVTHAQDLEGDAPAGGAEVAPPPPAADLNDAVNQLSKEQRHETNAPPLPPSVAPHGAGAHAAPKPFAQATKHKPKSHGPVKVAKKAKPKKSAKPAKKKKKRA